MTQPLRYESLDDLPLALTVAEVARLLRVSKSSVYGMVHVWQATDGREGLTAYCVGRTLRIPRWAVLELFRSGDGATA